MIVHRLALPDYRHYGCTIAMYELDLAFRRRDPVECICEGFDPGAIMAELMDAPAVRAKAERYGDMLRANEQPLRAWELSPSLLAGVVAGARGYRTGRMFSIPAPGHPYSQYPPATGPDRLIDMLHRIERLYGVHPTLFSMVVYATNCSGASV
ncbi:MAG: hypothetical protein ACOY45_01475 [Pseudomonadota bacterium]